MICQAPSRGPAAVARAEPPAPARRRSKDRGPSCSPASSQPESSTSSSVPAPTNLQQAIEATAARRSRRRESRPEHDVSSRSRPFPPQKIAFESSTQSRSGSPPARSTVAARSPQKSSDRLRRLAVAVFRRRFGHHGRHDQRTEVRSVAGFVDSHPAQSHSLRVFVERRTAYTMLLYERKDRTARI